MQRGQSFLKRRLTKLDSLGIIIQARLGSTRLPKKVLLPFYKDKSIIEYIWQRGITSKIGGALIVSSSFFGADEFSELGLAVSAPLVLESDVLSRYYITARNNNFRYIARITSDCPLVDFTLVNVLLQNVYDGCDYASVSHPIRRLPSGLDVEVFSFDALREAHFNAKDPSDREHVTPYMYRDGNGFILGRQPIATYGIYAATTITDKLSIDTLSDYKKVKFLAEKLITEVKPNYTAMDVLNMYEKYALEIKTIENDKT